MNELLNLVKFIVLAVFSKSETKTINLKNTPDEGIQLGIGKCKAVRLRLNEFVRNTVTAEIIAATHFYFGDSEKQEFEVVTGTDSKIIFCKHLEEVFIRGNFPSNVLIAGAGTAAAEGTYVYSGVNNGKPYYNKLGSLPSLTINAIVWTGAAWIITSAAAATYYTSANNVAFPYLVEVWTLGTGANPVSVASEIETSVMIQVLVYK